MIIYKTTNLINGKIYIGQDSNNNSSYLGSGVYFSNALNKYGKQNFKKEILEDDIETYDELNDREVYWIKELNSKRPNGYNLADGGKGSKGCKHTEEFKEYLYNINNKIIVYQYSLDGIFIRSFRSIKNAALNCNISNGTIINVLKGKSYTGGGYIWSDKKLNDVEIAEILYKLKYNKSCIPIFKYNLKCELLSEYGSILSAAIENDLDATHIGNCSKNQKKTCGGYIWSNTILTFEQISTLKEYHASNSKKAIIQYNLDGIIITEYKTIYQATKETNISHIRSCCNGLRKTAGGFIWKYKEI